MKNNKLIKYKENVFTKIFNFFKKIFSKKELSVNKEDVDETIKEEKNKSNFLEDIQIKEDKEEVTEEIVVEKKQISLSEIDDKLSNIDSIIKDINE